MCDGAVDWEVAEMKSGTTRSDVMVLDWKKVDCSLWCPGFSRFIFPPLPRCSRMSNCTGTLDHFPQLNLSSLYRTSSRITSSGRHRHIHLRLLTPDDQTPQGSSGFSAVNPDFAAACHTPLFPRADQSDDCFPCAVHNGLVICPEETIKRSCFRSEGFAAAAAVVSE